MSGIDRRGEGIRRALAGERPVRPRPVLVPRVEPPTFRRRDPRLLIAAIVCGVIALACLALAVWR